jgi:hypothetical protein
MVDMIAKPAEDETALLRREYNEMNVVIAANGQSLIALGRDRKGLSYEAMSPIQKKAFDQSNQAYIAEQAKIGRIAS